MNEIQRITTLPVKKPAIIIRDESQPKHKKRQQQAKKQENNQPAKHIDEMV